VLHGILIKNVGNKVKIIHEALPELYLEHVTDEEGESVLASLAKTAGGIVVNGSKEILSRIIKELVRTSSRQERRNSKKHRPNRRMA
jgi:hypothetical protein